MFYDIILYTPMYVTLFWAITLLLSNRKKNLAKYFLGIFMAAAFLVYVSHAIFFHKEQGLYLYIDPIYTLGSLLVYPLYYVYIKILSVDTCFQKKNWILFAPAIVLSGLTLLVYLLMPSVERTDYISTYFFYSKKGHADSLLQKIQRIIYHTGRGVFVIQVFYLLYKGSGLIKKYNKRIANFYSNIEDKSILWVNLLLWSFVATSLMSVVFNAIGKHYFLDAPLLLLIPSAIFSVLLFMIGIEGYMQNHSVRDLVSDEAEETLPDVLQSNKERLKEKLVQFFEIEKIYRNPNLKITDVSFLLNTNRTYVSQIINTDFDCSFSEFVGRYRIQEAKELLKTATATTYTLDYICHEVGFGSLHSFIRVFKKSTGCTPGSYRERYL